MTDQTLGNTTTIVTKEVEAAKANYGIVPTAAILGAIAGFIWKGLRGAAILGAVAAGGVIVYQKYKK